MKKKASAKSSKKVPVREALPDILQTRFVPLSPTTPHNGELTVDFNKYIVVYSNNVKGNQQSPWRAGCTSITCYKDTTFVGVISFYETRENLNGGYVDPNGVVSIEYPISRFEEVMLILRRFSNLSLLIVTRDLNGTALAHPVGAIMTFAPKSIGSA